MTRICLVGGTVVEVGGVGAFEATAPEICSPPFIGSAEIPCS
jgi:hypothetical protein